MARTRGGRSRTTRETPQLILVSTTIPQLPIDLISDILSRLSVKSLIRFKSVSKSWCNLIKSPTFIKQQQNYSKLNPNPVFNAVFSTVSNPRTGKQLFRVNLIDALNKPIDLNLPFVSDDTTFRILGICDGLVCVILITDLSVIIIFNPLTGEFRKIPPFRKFPEDEDYSYFGFSLNAFRGYELFRMVYKYLPGNIHDKLVLKGEAFSLTTNTWRRINVKRDGACFCNSCAPNKTVPVFIRGVFYWEATDFYKRYVVCFDVQREAFDVFEIPGYCYGATRMLRGLKEELAIAIYQVDWAFDIWILNEKNRCWARKFSLKKGSVINAFPRHVGSAVTVLGYAENGKLVIENCYKKELKLFLYDMDRNETEILPYVNIGAHRRVFLYTESLVSVNTGDGLAGGSYLKSD